MIGKIVEIGLKFESDVDLEKVLSIWISLLDPAEVHFGYPLLGAYKRRAKEWVLLKLNAS